MTLDSLRSLYVHELQDLYSAETQLVKALPQLAKGANASELKTAFQEHLAQTKLHVQRLEQVLEGMGESTSGDKCKGMAGLIKEGRDLLKQDGLPGVVDTALIAAAQKVEHYEISGYGSARTMANMLRLDDAADLLQQTLNEEKQTDERLTELAEALMSVADTAPERVEDVDMSGSRGPRGADIQALHERMGEGSPVDAAEMDDLSGATGPVDAGGSTGHWEERRPTGDPTSGD